MTSERAEAIALSVLSWLIAEDDMRGVFMGATGCDADALREGAGSPEFLASVLDFLLMDDAWVLACAEATGHAPDAFMAAHLALPGGAQTHWT